MKPFITEYRIIYGDCDPFDVVYYARYLDFFERGRTEMFRALGLPYKNIAELGIYTPVTEAGCRYIQSGRYDDMIMIETIVGQLRRASIRFDYKIYRKEPRTLLAEGFTVHAFVNKDRKILRVPQDIVDTLKKVME